MFDAAKERQVRAALKATRCFTRVCRGEVRDDSGEVEFLVYLSPRLAAPFAGRVRELVAARGLRIADNDIAAELEAVLLPHLDVGVPFDVEYDEDVDPEFPKLPDAITLVLRFPVEKTAKKTKNKIAKGSRAAPDYSSMTDAERKKAVRREEERLRSRRRRAEAKASRQRAGENVRIGRSRYVEKVYDPKREKQVWKATRDGMKVMREMNACGERASRLAPTSRTT